MELIQQMFDVFVQTAFFTMVGAVIYSWHIRREEYGWEGILFVAIVSGLGFAILFSDAGGKNAMSLVGMHGFRAGIGAMLWFQLSLVAGYLWLVVADRNRKHLSSSHIESAP